MRDIRKEASVAAEKRAKMMQKEAGGRMVSYSLSDFSDGYVAGYEAAKAEAVMVQCANCFGTGQVKNKSGASVHVVCPLCTGTGRRLP
jgi:DnaJ-class molecular chaperone